MNKPACLFAIQLGLFCAPLAANEEINYSMVAEAGSKRMDEIIIRYMRELGSPCITAQTLDPKSNWKTISSKYFCSLNGRSFLNDFADAHFEDLSFSERAIEMVLSITPLEPTGEQKLNCTIPIRQNIVQEMICEDRNNQ